MSAPDPLLAVRDLSCHFPIRDSVLGRQAGVIRAVDGVTLEIMPGETLGLVGESGCGKSTLGRLIARLQAATAGTVRFDGRDVLGLKHRALLSLRRDIQSVFQDPFASLNPRMSAFEIIEEPLVIHALGDRRERRNRVLELMEIVGLRPEYASRYPHEFSGGQRQRIGIARALALNPRLLILDEPVSALDVSIQAQIINLLQRLQRDLGLTYLFISHDLSVVEHMADRVAVMYLGEIVELAGNEDFFARPRHPYSQALLSALPVPDPKVARKRVVLTGELPSPSDLPEGCRFQTRCRLASGQCRTDPGPVMEQAATAHFVRCWNRDAAIA